MAAPALGPTLSVVIPAGDRPDALDRCVSAIEAAMARGDEVIVVTEPSAAGPALLRNLGAQRASGDVLVFVDADVVVHPQALDRMRAAFAADAPLAAVFGSYDARPAAGDPVSQFRNILHHHIHTTGAGLVETFWAGLGAVRRDIFHEVGGFDSVRYTQRRPGVEDIDLGLRLHDAGHLVRLDADIQGTHLKRWTVADMLRVDLRVRGASWVALMLQRRRVLSGLNLAWRHRVSALTSLVILHQALSRRPRAVLLLVGAQVWINRDLYRLVHRSAGRRAAALAVPLHIVHHLICALAVPWGLWRLKREALPGDTPGPAPRRPRLEREAGRAGELAGHGQPQHQRAG
jgi:Glycosyl transferase family 2